MKTILMCGCFRSGTTAAVYMLNQHPEVIFTNELQTFGSQNRRFVRERIIAKYAEHIFPESRLDIIGLRCAARKKRVLNSEQTVKLFASFCKPEVRLYGDKFPGYTLNLDHAVQQACMPKVICCIRDVREVIECQIRWYHSHVAKGLKPEHWMRNSIEGCLQGETWLHYMQSWQRFREKKKCLCHELHYRKLAEDTEFEAERLAKFLDIDVQPLKDIFLRDFRPKLGLWKNNYPHLTQQLPTAYLEMLASYGFEIY